MRRLSLERLARNLARDPEAMRRFNAPLAPEVLAALPPDAQAFEAGATFTPTDATALAHARLALDHGVAIDPILAARVRIANGYALLALSRIGAQ